MKQSMKNNRNVWKKLAGTAGMAVFGAVLISQPALASEAASGGAAIVTDGLNSLIDIIKAFVSSVGTMVVLWGLFEWGNSMQGHDGMMQAAAFKRIGGGLIMTLGPQLLSIFV